MSSRKQLQLLGLVVSLLVLVVAAFYQGSQDLTLPLADVFPTPSPVLGETTATGSAEMAVISRVIDGDTVELADGRKVRYIGIDTPETKDPRKGQECFGQQASHYNQELVEGKTVRLEKDVNDTDRYGRLLRYVFLDDELVNLKLVAEGYAVASSYPPDVSHQAELDLAENQARQAHLGLWGECPAVTP